MPTSLSFLRLKSSLLTTSEPFRRLPTVVLVTRILLLTAVVCAPAFAASPWERAVDALATSFTGPIAKGLALVAVVIGGVTFAFGEGDSKRLLAGIVFGIGMALGAGQFIAWLFL